MKYLAEKLANLNCVSVYVEVADENEHSIAFQDDSTLLLSSPGKVSLPIFLPCPIKPYSGVSFNQSCRLRLTVADCPVEKSSEESFVPPRCPDGKLLSAAQRWKQLPSEHWAELMDLWHCHKPHAHDSDLQGGLDSHTTGLYKLAMEGFQPKPGLSYYSDTYYLVHPSDLHTGFQGPKVYKWELGTPVTEVVGLQVKQLVNAHAVFVYEVSSKILIWVLSTDALYTADFSPRPRRGVKIGFGNLTLQATKFDPEILDYPENTVTALIEDLKHFNASLPASAQMVNGWNLAVL